MNDFFKTTKIGRAVLGPAGRARYSVRAARRAEDCPPYQDCRTAKIGGAVLPRRPFFGPPAEGGNFGGAPTPPHQNGFYHEPLSLPSPRKAGRGWPQAGRGDCLKISSKPYTSKEAKGRFLVTAVLGSLALIVAGCNLAPKYTKPAVETPPAFKEASGWKVAQPKDDSIRGKWWEMFNDPDLNALEEKVAVSNQTVQGALATFQAARAVVKEARSQYYPAVSVNPSATVGKASANAVKSSPNPIPTKTTQTYTLPADASWEPDLWGTTRNTVKAARYNAQADAATYQSLRLTAQAELAADYYSLRSQDVLQKVLNDTVAADSNTVRLTEALFNSGIDSDEDVSTAQTVLATGIAQATGVAVLRAQYEHAIAMLIGQSPSTFSIPIQLPATNSPSHMPSIPLALPSELLERRPDIAAAERSVAAANAQIGVAKAAFFPTLSLSASGGLESVSLGSLFSGPSAFWSAGAAAAQTVFDAGLRAATVEQYRANYNGTVANYRQTVLTAFQQVEDNLAALRILSKEWEQQQTAVNLSAKTLAIATHRFELGIDSYLNVLAAQDTLLANEETAVGIQQSLLTSSVGLIMALGGGWDASQMPAGPRLSLKTTE
ncbi:MAG: efflux transporter outer membrane subunit [Limisphaerales bacterium]